MGTLALIVLAVVIVAAIEKGGDVLDACKRRRHHDYPPAGHVRVGIDPRWPR